MRRWWPHGRQWAIVVVIVLLLVGGVYVGENKTSSPGSHRGSTGGTKGSASTLRPVRRSYLASGSDFVDFIRWTDDRGTIKGSAEAVTTQGTAPQLTTTSTTLDVQGKQRGSNISLSFDHGPKESGKITSGSFTLDFPQPGGTPAPVTFRKASAPLYNEDVSSLSQRVTQANQRVSDSQALVQAEQAIDNEAATVLADISTLSEDEASTNTDLQAIQAVLQTETTQVATTQQAEQQVASESSSSPQAKTCADAGAVGTDAAAVANDLAQVSTDATQVQGTLSSGTGLDAEVAQLNSDYSQLQSEEAALNNYVPSNGPSQTDVSNASTAATNAEQSTVTTTNGYIDQANSGTTTAYQYVAQAFQAGKCGTGPTAPSPVQHIS